MRKAEQKNVTVQCVADTIPDSFLRLIAEMVQEHLEEINEGIAQQERKQHEEEKEGIRCARSHDGQ